MALPVPKKTDAQNEEDLFQLFDQEGIEFWNFLKQHKDEIVTMVQGYRAETLLGQHEARVETDRSDPLSNKQYTAAEKKELDRLRLFVKDYFAEFFLASMSIIGMILAVLYMLAHTWR
jgi:hypothetical protein